MNRKHEQLHFEIARLAMIDQGLEPDFSAEVRRQVEEIDGPASGEDPSVRDLRQLLWCSIDNDDSRDLDQLTYGVEESGHLRVYVAVADVDALVKNGTPVLQPTGAPTCTPNPGFGGTDTFVYRVIDPQGALSSTGAAD